MVPSSIKINQVCQTLNAHLFERGDGEGLELLNNLLHELNLLLALPSEDGLRRIFYFLADCEAATATDHAYTKSRPASERRRHRNICVDLLKSIEAGDLVGHRESKPEQVIQRLKDSIAAIDEFEAERKK